MSKKLTKLSLKTYWGYKMPETKNKNVWRYIYNYEVNGSNDKYYFDIMTNKGKSMAEKLAMDYMSNLKKNRWNWTKYTYIAKRKVRG